jgi:hypothetical protein
MFSKKPATPPRLWSKCCPSLRGFEMVCSQGQYGFRNRVRRGKDLQHPLILLRLRPVNLLDGLHVLLEVADGMLPGLQPLGEQAGSLLRVRS